jgi:hypothetical protein
MELLPELWDIILSLARVDTMKTRCSLRYVCKDWLARDPEIRFVVYDTRLWFSPPVSLLIRGEDGDFVCGGGHIDRRNWGMETSRRLMFLLAWLLHGPRDLVVVGGTWDQLMEVVRGVPLPHNLQLVKEADSQWALPALTYGDIFSAIETSVGTRLETASIWIETDEKDGILIWSNTTRQ